MRTKIIAGNWKMNGAPAEAIALIEGLLSASFSKDDTGIVVCPSFTSLETASRLLNDSRIALGAQDMSIHQAGAYTGEVSAQMLLTVGVSYVILGHSERRQYHAEDDRLVNAKCKSALKAGLTPIICVGETLKQRENGRTEEVIGSQVEIVLSGFTTDMVKKSVIAYEPVWAIGTGKTASPEMAQAVHSFIREKVSVDFSEAAERIPILYGGSVKPSNAAELMKQPDIDGALVGGASLKAEDFVAIINAV